MRRAPPARAAIVSRAVDLGWGDAGVQRAMADGSIVVIVDVLRFSSTVTTAVANGFTIAPCARAEDAARLAESTGAIPSGPTGRARYSLSPLDYLNPHEPEEVALVSPNGAALCASLGEQPGYIACLLNARTAGRLLRSISEQTGRGVMLVAAGEAVEDQERNLADRRFALEDYLGCGALLAELRMEMTADATVCCRAFEASSQDYPRLIRECASGQYLVCRGQEYDISHCVQRSIYEILPEVRGGRIAPARSR